MVPGMLERKKSERHGAPRSFFRRWSGESIAKTLLTCAQARRRLSAGNAGAHHIPTVNVKAVAASVLTGRRR